LKSLGILVTQSDIDVYQYIPMSLIILIKLVINYLLNNKHLEIKIIKQHQQNVNIR
jgi:hypothetical protein